MAAYLGDFAEDVTLRFLWSTNAAAGGSITRATDGTVAVYKDNGTTESTAGITDTEDFDSLTGIHACTIDLSADAFYATGSDYSVVLQNATIDGETVNAVLAHFSIENRFGAGGDVTSINGNSAAAVRLALSAGQIIPGTVDNSVLTPTTTQFECDDITEATADHYVGRVWLWTTGNLAGQVAAIQAYSLNTGRGRFTVSTMTEAPGNNDTGIII